MKLNGRLFNYSKKEGGGKVSRPVVPPQPGPTPLVPSASLEAEDDMGECVCVCKVCVLICDDTLEPTLQPRVCLVVQMVLEACPQRDVSPCRTRRSVS